MIRRLLFVLGFFIIRLPAMAQHCTALGQTPATAFPVCGSSTFTQTSVPACVNGDIPVPCNTTDSYQDLNPFWYKFTCFTSGTLGLTITPKNLGDDYDWQIFDVTGVDVSEVYTNKSLLVGCNWSGLTGVTGTNSSATSLTECGSTNNVNPPIFSEMPSLVQGHNYLLLISHFTGDSQSGYDLSFAGGTASITDTLQPALKAVQVICNDKLRIILNKKMKCSSLAPDGSDFSINSPSVHPISATGTYCNSGFDMDTVILNLNASLNPSSYTLTAKNGTDQNTLLDICDNQVPVGAFLPFQIYVPQPTPFDSVVPLTCAPSQIELVFQKTIMCSSIAANGSDFTVTGPFPVTVTGASAACDSTGESNTIFVQLASPMVNGGNYQISLSDGVDGNTIIDECGLSTPVGSVMPLVIKDTVSAAFDDLIKYGCQTDTVQYSYPEKNGVNKWAWTFDDGSVSNLEDVTKNYTVWGDKTIRLIVTNGFCTDTVSEVVSLDNAIHAAFEAPSILCPQDGAAIVNNSTGIHLSWSWDFGDGTQSTEQQPANHFFPQTGVETKYRLSLIIENNLGCKDTAYWQTDVLRSCYIAVPSAFTPNGDGVNDYLYPLNAYKAEGLQFRVFNRYGELVFTGRSWLDKWDGTLNGHPEPVGTYVWMLSYTDGDTGKKVFMKGTAILIR